MSPYPSPGLYPDDDLYPEDPRFGEVTLPANVGQTLPPDPTDAYGIDLRLSSDGDLMVSRTGDLLTVQGPENVAHALTLRMRTYPGELPLHDEYGSALLSKVIGAKSSDDAILASQARIEVQRILESDRRFLAARDVTALVDPDDPTIATVSLTLELAGGDTLLVGDLTRPRIDQVITAADQLDSDLVEASDLFDDEDPDLDDFDDELGAATLDTDSFNGLIE